ncbi:MAG: GTPase, partial [Petrotogales bacterium]
HLVSATRKFGINRLMKILSQEKERKFLLMGMTNVGKSSLINALKAEDVITVSEYPGTTMETFNIYDKKYDITFIDSPGISTNNRINDFISLECQKKITPKKKLKVFTLNSKKDRTFFMGGFVKVTVKGRPGNDSPIINILTSENSKVHETNPEKAIEMWSDWFGTLLSPPCKKKKLKEYTWEEWKAELNTSEEVNISGLGWFSVARGPTNIHIKFPSGLKLIARQGLVGPTTFR